MSRLLATMLIILIFTSHGLPNVGASEELKGRLFKEGPVGWAKLRSLEIQSSGTIYNTTWSIEAGKSKKTGPIKLTQFQRNGDLLALVFSREGFPGQTVCVSGPKYAFKLDRKDSSIPYTLQNLVFDTPSVTVKNWKAGGFLDHILDLTRACWSIPLEDLIADPAFTLVKIDERSDDRGTIVKVDFRCDSKRHNLDFEDAWVTLRPSEDWAVQSAEFNLKKNWRISTKNEYAPDGKGRLRLKQADQIYFWNERKLEEHYEHSLRNYEGQVVADSAFTLPAYGLPEPFKPVSVNYQSSVQYWFVGSGIALLALAFAIRWRARQTP